MTRTDRTWLRRKPGIAALVAGLFAFAGGCSGDSDKGTNPGPDPDPSGVSLTRSIVTVFPQSIEPAATSTLMLVARDGNGNNLGTGGLAVAFSATGGTSQGQLGAAVDHADGTYTATFTASGEGTPLTIGATIDGGDVSSQLPTLQVRSLPALTDTTAAIPLIDMAGLSYRSHPGLLYPEGNDCPPAHAAMQPAVNTSVPFVFLSIGFSNVKMEFCDPFATRETTFGGGKIGPQECASHSFVGKVWGDPALNDNLAIVNGAQSGRAADEWDAPGDGTYGIVLNRLTGLGHAEADVQVIWCKMANIRPTTSLPGGPAEANAFTLLRTLGDVVRTCRVKYPNLKQMYFSSRIWSCGDALSPSPEPFAYENAYSVKWLIEAQIRQLQGGGQDALALDLGLDVAPWLAWGPYPWANGPEPRSDGLVWTPADFKPDCTHPNVTGRDKVAVMLRDFFMTSELTTPWFLD